MLHCEISVERPLVIKYDSLRRRWKEGKGNTKGEGKVEGGGEGGGEGKGKGEVEGKGEGLLL